MIYCEIHVWVGDDECPDCIREQRDNLLEVCRSMVAVLESIFLLYPDLPDETDWLALSTGQAAIAETEG